MNPRTSMVDRLLLIVLALVLLLGGIWFAVWSEGGLPAGWWSPSGLTVGLAEDMTGVAWWATALLLGGLVLAVVGLVWLASHFRPNGVGVLALPGTDRSGRLTMDASALASGAAASLRIAPRCPRPVDAFSRRRTGSSWPSPRPCLRRPSWLRSSGPATTSRLTSWTAPVVRTSPAASASRSPPGHGPLRECGDAGSRHRR